MDALWLGLAVGAAVYLACAWRALPSTTLYIEITDKTPRDVAYEIQLGDEDSESI